MHTDLFVHVCINNDEGFMELESPSTGHIHRVSTSVTDRHILTIDHQSVVGAAKERDCRVSVHSVIKGFLENSDTLPYGPLCLKCTRRQLENECIALLAMYCDAVWML